MEVPPKLIIWRMPRVPIKKVLRTILILNIKIINFLTLFFVFEYLLCCKIRINATQIK